jgi:hypothetical protein
METDNTTRVLTRFIAALAIPVTRQSINDELQKHPEYNSLLAFSDVLDHWRVPNGACQLTVEQLAEVPLPFIAHLSKKEFAVVTALNEKQVTVSNERWNGKVLPMEEFKKLYSGTILIAEKDVESGEPDYANKRKKEIVDDWRLPVVFTGAAIILLAFLTLHTSYLNTFSLQVGLLTFFKTAGLVTAVFLLMQSIDANNPLIQRLCGGDNNRDCNAILSSKAAKITAWLSWSEVGFFYFAGTWLVLLFNSGHTAIIQALALLNIVSLPYTFYSINFQWRVVKMVPVLLCHTGYIMAGVFRVFTLPVAWHTNAKPYRMEQPGNGHGYTCISLGIGKTLLIAVQTNTAP